MKNRPLLVLCIDRDNDLYEKAKVTGPLIGRDKNLQGALALSLADPEDSDSNAIYYAIKTYDKLAKEGESVEVVTLTGDKSLGYTADRNISNQLDRVVREFAPSSCIFVSDGASDEEILPIIKSRIKVDSTKIVVIKQAKELEKTYFVLLEKLRDPYFARMFIGIPAVLILMLSLSSYLGWGWQPVGIIIGIVLLLHILRIDTIVGEVVGDLTFSYEKTSWIGYIGAFAMFCIALFVGYQTVTQDISLGIGPDKIVAAFAGSTAWIVFLGLMMILLGKSIDASAENRKYEISRYMFYSLVAGILTFLIIVGSRWVVNMSAPYVDFPTFLIAIALSIVAAHAATSGINYYRKRIILEMKIEGKEAISEHGTYIGRVVGVDVKKGNLIIQNLFDKRYAIAISSIHSVGDNVVMKSDE
ncbi:DUF373 family protein [Candidatus Micrarchaeota archaeon]|nr:DUF373 family protein [Candidatus Micrarchaeota archaeon]